MEDVYCGLCGEKIGKKKGQRGDIFKAELQAGRHHVCGMARQAVARKYNVGAGQHLNAVITALFEKFPDLKETEAYREYDRRVDAAEVEILGMFPHLAALKKADEEEKKKRAQEVDTEAEAAAERLRAAAKRNGVEETRSDEMICGVCGEEMIELSRSETDEIVKEKNIDFTKAPDPEAAKFFFESAPLYKCQKCGRLVVDAADVVIAASCYAAKVKEGNRRKHRNIQK